MGSGNILYSGVPLAGCETSLGVIVADCDPRLTLQRVRSSPCEARWNQTRSLRLMQEYYSNLYIPRLLDALHDVVGHAHWNRLVPGWRELAAFFKIVDGVVFVVDSQRERIEAGLGRVEHLTANLRDCGRDPRDISLVFQLNKRDLPNVEPVDVLRDAFRWPGPSTYVESVAPRAIGVRDALNAAIQLVENIDGT